MIPIVYVETNWIIAYLFPHDERHKDAKELLQQAKQGACEIRIPEIAFIEARGTMSNTNAEFQKQLTRIETLWKNACDAGWTNFDVAHYSQSINNNPYFGRNLVDELERIKRDASVHSFVDPAEEIAEIGRVKTDLNLLTKDMKDLYILCAILVDRQKEENNDSKRPALFMNTNDREFSPGRNKVPQDFYDRHRLLYCRGFNENLTTAARKWTSKYDNP